MAEQNRNFNPEQDVVPLRFEYNGIRIFGYAKGRLEGKISTFEITSGIGTFVLQACEKGPAHYKWRSLNQLFPRQEIIKMIGMKIERFFRNLKE